MQHIPQSDDTRWVHFFDQHLSRYHSLLEYAAGHWQYNLPIFHAIQAIAPPPSRLLEIGCGLGVSAIYLHSCGYSVTAVDNDPQLVKQASETAAYFHADIHIDTADAFDLSRYRHQFDLVYSMGVLEHFDRDVTIQLLREQSQCGQYVLMEVPSKFTEPITDERIYTIPQLRQIFREAGLQPVKSFGYGNPTKLLHLRRLLPHALYRILQNVFSLAQGLVVIGKSSV